MPISVEFTREGCRGGAGIGRVRLAPPNALDRVRFWAKGCRISIRPRSLAAFAQPHNRHGGCSYLLELGGWTATIGSYCDTTMAQVMLGFSAVWVDARAICRARSSTSCPRTE